MAVIVAEVLAFTGCHFGVPTLRAVTLSIVLALLVAITAYGQTPPADRLPAVRGPGRFTDRRRP
jgi:hypothetical protein